MALNLLGERNEQFVGRTGGEIVISTPAKNITAKKIVYLANLITTREPASFSMNNMSSGAHDKVTAYTNSGKIAGQVSTNEQDPAGDITFGFQEDYIFIGEALGLGSKSKLLNLLNGEAFYNSPTNVGDILIPVGTNGTEKGTGGQARPYEMNQLWKSILNNEGSEIKSGGTDPKTGMPLTKRNPYADALNKEQKTICAEFLSTSGSGVSVNRMFPILAKSTLDYTEGDVNAFSITMNRGCDLTERAGYFWETVETPPAKKEDFLKEFEVDYIVKNGGTEPANGVTAGQLLASIDDKGEVSIKKYASSRAWTADTSLATRVGYGTRIMARKRIETGTTVIEGNVFVVVDSVSGASGSEKIHAINFSLDETANKEQYFVEVLLFNRDTGVYEPYITPDAIGIKRPTM